MVRTSEKLSGGSRKMEDRSNTTPASRTGKSLKFSEKVEEIISEEVRVGIRKVKSV